MSKIFSHNPAVLAGRLDHLYNRYDWKLENTHKYSIFFDKMGSLIDNTEQMNELNQLLQTWVNLHGMPIKVFEFHLQNISYSVYNGHHSNKKLQRKVKSFDLQGFPIIRTITIDWYVADQQLGKVVSWCYAVLNKMAIDYDVDTRTIYTKDSKRHN